MQCELCGKEEALLRTSVEGIELMVCEKCSKYGKLLPNKPASLVVPSKKPERQREEPAQEIVVGNYAVLVKQAREALGLKQEEFANKISEKTSLIHNIESGRYQPPIELARKIERFLKIKLVEEYKENSNQAKPKAAEGLTVGDLIKLG
ncbi:MAG: multiprotein bridging factor aMBF1 [Candidatus Woesearchaeota archaeon]